MLFFGNPFLISGFVRRGWERIRMQKCREREREIESHPKMDTGQTKRVATPRGNGVVSVCT